MTARALENAVAVLYACGGSTNCVLHLLAIAHEAGIPKADFCIDDFDRVGRHVPLLVACSPHGEGRASPTLVGGMKLKRAAALSLPPQASTTSPTSTSTAGCPS